MSWITDIAGKAEDLLNKIDHSAATVLNNDKNKKNKKSGIESRSNVSSPANVKKKYSPPPMPPMSVIASPQVNNISTIQETNKRDEEVHYHDIIEADSSPLKGFSEPNDKLTTVSSGDLKIDVENITDKKESFVSLENENSYLRNEVRSLTSEVSLLMSRIKGSERELALARSLLTKKETDVIVLEKEVLSLKQRLENIQSENSELYNENLRLKKLSEKKENDEKMNYDNECKLSQYQMEFMQKEAAFKSDIASLRIRIGELEESLLKEKVETAKELSEANSRLAEARKELEDYRAKAQWTLAEKEKLINELKKSGSDALSDDVLSLELQQIREERGKLIDELEEMRVKLENSRKQEFELEKRLESVREECTATLRSTQGRLADETARRLAAEEHSASHAKELHSVKEELWSKVSSLNSKLKERERELSRLRRQLSERVMIRPDQELTAALVQKQESIEQLTIEMNQLRLQLERVKLAYNEDMTRNSHQLHLNDTDDAKARLPSFKVGLSQLGYGMRCAYSCIDRIHRAAFFRRYPVARLVIFSYLVLLHLGICLVLFSYTPENHPNV